MPRTVNSTTPKLVIRVIKKGMPEFIYKAKKSPKEVILDTITAENKDIAINRIKNLGYYLLTINEYTSSSQDISRSRKAVFQKRIDLKDIAYFTRQLSDLLESGLTIIKALDILHNQTENNRLKEIILDIHNFCLDGNPLSSAISRHPQAFSNLSIGMVRSGEASGALENVLRDLSDFYDKQLDIKLKIRSALAYPILMSAVGCGTVIILLTIVIPKMMSMFGDLGQALPLPTLVLMNISSYIRSYWWMLLSFVLFLFFIFKSAYRSKEGRLSIDRFKLKTPFLGNTIKKIEIARFARTLGTLLANGVPMLHALSIVAETINNVAIKEEVIKAASFMREGSSLTSGFHKSSIIPPLVVNMIAVGEEGGRIEKALFKVVENYEREIDRVIKTMMSLLEPVLILFLGIVVGFIVLSMLLPIFEINFLVR